MPRKPATLTRVTVPRVMRSVYLPGPVAAAIAETARRAGVSVNALIVACLSHSYGGRRVR